jgi:hypothetical protein
VADKPEKGNRLDLQPWIGIVGLLVAILGLIFGLGLIDRFNGDSESEPPQQNRRAPPARVLLAIDVSGSMDWALSTGGDQRRIDAAVTATLKALERLGSADELGLWVFARGRHIELVPINPLGAERDRVEPGLSALMGRRNRPVPISRLRTQRDQVEAGLAALLDRKNKPTGGTPLYDTIASGVQTLQRGWRKGSALVVLTDGRDHRSTTYPTAEELNDQLDVSAGGKPVRVLLTSAFKRRCDRTLSAVGRCLPARTPPEVLSVLRRILARVGKK